MRKINDMICSEYPSGIGLETYRMIETGKKSSLWPLVRRELCWLTIPLGFALAAVLALNVDCRLSGWCVEQWNEKNHISRILLSVRDLLGVFENFGNGWGVAAIVLAIFVLDSARRWALPRLLGCAYGAGMAANGLKLFLSRTRPNDFEFPGDVWTTFGAWLPGTAAGSIGQSFPSAHTATAVGFAAGLVWLYPRGRWMFPVFAVLVGCQRIQSGAHFLSDTLAGAALGSLIALAFLKCGLLPEWMERLECAMKKEKK
jgi:membrane-associated phospholipid phosphatase